MSSNQVVPLKSGARLTAIVPQTFEDVQRIAIMAVRAGLGPSAWNDNAEQSVAKATAAIMHGLELGLSPMQSLSGIAVINGKTTIYGDLLTAVLWSNGFKVKKWIEGEGDNMVARARITRPDGEVIEDKFSVEQAKQARLWDTREQVQKKGKDNSRYMAPNDSAWYRFREDMLGWKALGRCCRAGASDATRGMMIREDMENPVVDITPTADALDPPDPDKQPDTIANDIPNLPQEQPDTIADAKGVLAKLRSDLDDCKNDAERMEVWEGMADLISRLSDAEQSEAEKIFEQS